MGCFVTTSDENTTINQDSLNKENVYCNTMSLSQHPTISRAKTIVHNLKAIECVLNNNSDELNLLREENKYIKSKIAILESDAESWKELETVVNRLYTSCNQQNITKNAGIIAENRTNVENYVDANKIEKHYNINSFNEEEIDVLNDYCIEVIVVPNEQMDKTHFCFKSQEELQKVLGSDHSKKLLTQIPTQPFSNEETLQERLGYMKELQPGWLDADSVEVDKDVISLAYKVAVRMLLTLPLPDIGSAGDGSLDLTWKGIYLTLYKTKFRLSCLTATSTLQETHEYITSNYPSDEFVAVTIKNLLESSIDKYKFNF